MNQWTARRINRCTSGLCIGIFTALLGGAGIYAVFNLNRLQELIPELYYYANDRSVHIQ